MFGNEDESRVSVIFGVSKVFGLVYTIPGHDATVFGEDLLVSTLSWNVLCVIVEFPMKHFVCFVEAYKRESVGCLVDIRYHE